MDAQLNGGFTMERAARGVAMMGDGMKRAESTRRRNRCRACGRQAEAMTFREMGFCSDLCRKRLSSE